MRLRRALASVVVTAAAPAVPHTATADSAEAGDAPASAVFSAVSGAAKTAGVEAVFAAAYRRVGTEVIAA